jgi:Flp pilus assembly protein TadG
MMPRRALKCAVKDCRGAAAAEMALVLPLLTILLFGSAELGNYFLNEHAVVKAVRDGARYASRLPMTDYPSCTPSSDAVTRIRNVTRTGSTAGASAGNRLAYWEDTMAGSPTIFVEAVCDTSGTYTGIYDGLAMGVPQVTVRASVPYQSLFGIFGLFNNNSFHLNARSEAAVMGI